MAYQFIKKTVKIRKPHVCIFCLIEYPKGDTMICETDQFDHHNSVYFCLKCNKLREEIEKKNYNDIFAEKPKRR
jgi:hypothetical protein